MREISRPAVDCITCGAKIYSSSAWVGRSDGDAVHANWEDPPNAGEKCPRCGEDVDTTNAYPFIPTFPSNFEQLRKAYAGFVPTWEHNRKSFDDKVGEFLSDGHTFADCQTELNTEEGTAWFKQRMFYRSATGFYRALQLFLGYLTLDRHCYISWAAVTAYYSRFYFIQSFLNLLLSTYLNLGKRGRAFFFFDGEKIVCRPQNELPPILIRKSSHDMWWGLMEALKSPDYPCENLNFILSRLVFNPERRQEVNYDYDYIGGGFPELNWFDSGWKQMLNHFMPRGRSDRDITNMDRFFAGRDPEDCDVGDFYGDDAQIIWCSLVGYLQLLKALDFQQNFVSTETIVALAQVHIGEEFPKLLQGIAQSTSEILNDGFDLPGFKDHPGKFFSRF
jgi:hypothetical protein